MKKFIAMILVVMMLIGIGTAAYAANEEEGPKDLIGTLMEEGFIYDEYEEVWMYMEYTFYGDGEYEYIHGWFDTEENFGMAMLVSYNKFGIVDECTTSAVRWNSATCELEELGTFEYTT